MIFYSYVEPIYEDGELIGDAVSTSSVEDIHKNYYPYWKKRMIEKFGEYTFHQKYCFQDCLDDWIVVNWAWLSDEQGNPIKGGS